MELPNLFGSPTQLDHHYLVVLLSDCTVQAALLAVTGDAKTDLHLEVEQRSVVHDYDTADECVKAADRGLQELGKNSEHIDEVIFGFEPSWVTPAGVSDDKKPLLKRLTQDLALKAVGFVVTTEAIHYHLKDTESLISALVLSLAPSQLVVTLIKQGLLIGSETVGRSGDAAADVVEALARFKHVKDPGYVPPKFLLVSAGVNQDEVVAVQQTLLAYDWISNQEFVQQPTIDILPSTTLLDRVAHQGGRAVAAAHHKPPASSGEQPVELEAEVADSDEPVQPDLETDGQTEFGQELGFETVQPQEGEIADSPNGLVTDEEPSDEVAVETAVEPHRAAFGVPLSGKAWDKWQAVHEPELVKATDQASGHGHHQTKHPHHSAKGLAGFKQFWHDHRGFVLIGSILGVLSWGIIGWVMAGQLTRFEITITPETKVLSQDLTLKLDPKATQSSPDQTTLAAQTATKEVTGEKTVPTTGIKVVGEQARGKVTLINKTDSVKTFTAGTVLSAGQVSFALDKDVTVASASVSRQGSDGETKTYGKTEGNAVARVVGEASNIAGNTTLKVADFAASTYEAVTVGAFTGGSSHEARVVSEKDRDKAAAELKAQLLADATKIWETESTGGRYFVPTNQMTLTETEYDHKVGEEAESLQLKAVGTANALSYSSTDLEQVAQAVLAQQLPSGFHLSAGAPQLLSSPAETASRSTTVSLAVNISKVAVAQLDQQSWLSLVAGKSVTEATTQLQDQPGVAKAQIRVLPAWLAQIMSTVSRDPAKVMIKVEEPS